MNFKAINIPYMNVSLLGNPFIVHMFMPVVYIQNVIKFSEYLNEK